MLEKLFPHSLLETHLQRGLRVDSLEPILTRSVRSAHLICDGSSTCRLHLRVGQSPYGVYSFAVEGALF